MFGNVYGASTCCTGNSGYYPVVNYGTTNNNIFTGNSGYPSYMSGSYSDNGFQQYLSNYMQFMSFLQGINGSCGYTGSSSCSTGTDYNSYDWGANTDTGCCNQGDTYIDQDDSGKYNMDSGLSYSTISLKNKDTDKDNRTSISEYGEFGDIADRDGDGYISPSEDLAMKLAMDSDCDGKISSNDTQVAEARYQNNKTDFSDRVKYIFTNYQNSSGQTLADKEKGPYLYNYSTDNTLAKSSSCTCNQGLDDFWNSCFGTSFNGPTSYKDNDGVVDIAIDNGAEKSKNILKAKAGSDNVVTTAEYGLFGDVADPTGDGKVSATEDLAVKKVIDSDGNGIITKAEMQNAISGYTSDKAGFKTAVQNVFYNNKDQNGNTLWSKYQGPDLSQSASDSTSTSTSTESTKSSDNKSAASTQPAASSQPAAASTDNTQKQVDSYNPKDGTITIHLNSHDDTVTQKAISNIWNWKCPT